MSMSTIEAPTREDVDRKTDNGDFLGDKDENFADAMRTQGPLEWLEDDMESREMDDPYHILLLDQTFEKPKITVDYVATSLKYVLDMPLDEATELSQFSFENGMSCLGTWPREECLGLGRQLQIRDIVCRIVPYCEGGHRGWQAKDASDANNMRKAE
jgi:ATP-dependent Clp protease adapter protein ClpS